MSNCGSTTNINAITVTNNNNNPIYLFPKLLPNFTWPLQWLHTVLDTVM